VGKNLCTYSLGSPEQRRKARKEHLADLLLTNRWTDYSVEQLEEICDVAGILPGNMKKEKEEKN